jgi:enoyl-CoA hydratase
LPSTLAHVISYLHAPQAEYGPVEGIAATNRLQIVFLLVLVLIVAGNLTDAMPAIMILMPSSRGRMPADNLVLVERLEGGVAKLTLNKPPLNLVTLEMAQRLIEVLEDVDKNESVRAVVVTGAGDKAFCAGSDVKEFMAVRDRVVEKKLARENRAFGGFELLSKPVIAAIEGLAYGGGCEIAMACDLRIIAANARMALPEVKLGVVPGSGGLFRLPELVGPARAMELMYFGDPISAREAEYMGLVNEVVPDGEALPRALDIARRISRQPKEAVAAIKRGVRESAQLTREEAVQLTLELSDRVFKTEDCAEGIRAFFEKREPRFEGAPGDDPPGEDAEETVRETDGEG